MWSSRTRRVAPSLLGAAALAGTLLGASPGSATSSAPVAVAHVVQAEGTESGRGLVAAGPALPVAPEQAVPAGPETSPRSPDQEAADGQAPSTPAPVFAFSSGISAATRIDKGGSPADSNIAASRTHLCTTTRGAFACYSKAGALVSAGAGLEARGYEAAEFFERSGIPIATAFDGSTTNKTKDGRVVYDRTRSRFFMVFQSRETRARHLIAVSLTDNPSDGWRTYADDIATADADNHDYQLVGVNARHLLVTSDPVCTGQTSICSSAGRKTSINYMYDATKLANGTGISRGQWSHVDAIRAAPAVHNTSSTDAFWADSDGLSAGSVWAVRDGVVYRRSHSLQAVQTPSVSAAMNGIVTWDNIGVGPQNAEFRGGRLVWAATVAKTWSGQSSSRHAVRLVRLDLSQYFASTPRVTVLIDRVFGLSSPDDPAGSVYDYGWPAVAQNSTGDIVVGSVRANSSIHPELRASTYLAGQTDLSPSRLLQAGTAHLGQFHMAGAASDPTTTGVYLSQQYGYGSPAWRVRFAKVLGRVLPDLTAASTSGPSSATRGSTIAVNVTVLNQGDGPAAASLAALYLSPDSTVSTSDRRVGSFDVPALARGASTTIVANVTLPPDAPTGSQYIGAVLDMSGAVVEHSETNNRNPRLTRTKGNLLISLS